MPAVTLVAVLAGACGPPSVTTPSAEGSPPVGRSGEELDGEDVGVSSEPDPPAGLVAVDYYDPAQAPPPPVAAVLDLPPCVDDGRLAAWVGERLAPFGGPDDAPFETVRLEEVIDVAPVLRDGDPVCALAGRQGDAHAWELRGAGDAVLATGVASPELVAAFPRVYDRQRELGGVNFGQAPLASRQHVSGVLREGLLELELFMHRPPRSALYVVEIPGIGSVPDGMAGQQVADALVGRLTTSRLAEPFSTWPSPLPRALPPGYARCAGPYQTEGFQTEATELCNADGEVIVVHTDNNGANPVPDPPVRTEVAEVDGRVQVAILTPVEDVLIDAPASLGRDLVEAMAATVPIADRRVWFPARGRGQELAASYGPEWLAEVFTEAGAEDVAVTEGAWGCDDIEGADCSPPNPLPHELRMRDGDGNTIEAYTSALTKRYAGEQTGPAGSITRVYTIGDTDLLVEDDTRTARAECGGVLLDLRPAGFGSAETPDHDRADPSIALLARVLEQLAC